MAEVPKLYGDGGVHGDGTPQKPALGKVLFDLIDDINARTPATIASADASDLATAITLVNEIKAALNTASATTLKTTKGA
jgi:hypothetical protein